MGSNDGNEKTPGAQQSPGAEQFWYNTKTREVETGHQSSWTHLMGPYATRSEAEAALANAKSRNEDWESEDDNWK